MRDVRMKKIRWLQLAVLLFIGLNFALVYMDDEGKVDRVSYVNEWSESLTRDMKEELIKPAVLAAETEWPIYFDESQGAFDTFLVKKGELVAEGQALFTYRVNDYYETEAKLLNDLERLDSEIAATEQAIMAIEFYQIMDGGDSPLIFEELEEEGFYLEIGIPSSTVDAQFMKEQFLAEKNKELAVLQGEVWALESQLASLEETGDTVSYISPYSGRVSELSTTLDSPLLVVESVELMARGDLTESERVLVEEGMQTRLDMDQVDLSLQGMVDSIADAPKNLTVKGNSVYPFGVRFVDEDDVDSDSDSEEDFADADNVDRYEDDGYAGFGDAEEDDTHADFGDTEDGLESEEAEEEADVELLPGYHGTLAILLEERLNVTAVEEEALIDGAVWKMNREGLLVKQAVETGLEEDGQVEVLEEKVTPGEVLAVAPQREFRNMSHYITPLKWSQLTRQSFNPKETEWKKQFLTGLLSR